MSLKTFEFKEGTIIAEVSEEMDFDMEAGTITDLGRFTACIIGGTAPEIHPALVIDPKTKEEKIFSSQAAAFAAAIELAVKMGYHPKKSGGKVIEKKPPARKARKN